MGRMMLSYGVADCAADRPTDQGTAQKDLELLLLEDRLRRGHQAGNQNYSGQQHRCCPGMSCVGHFLKCKMSSNLGAGLLYDVNDKNDIFDITVSPMSRVLNETETLLISREASHRLLYWRPPVRPNRNHTCRTQRVYIVNEWFLYNYSRQAYIVGEA